MADAKKLSVTRLHSSNSMLIILSMCFLVLGFYFTLVSISMSDIATQIIGIAIGIAIIAIDFIFFIPPIATSNLLTATRLILRYGLQFKVELPLKNIASIERLERQSGLPLVISIGVKYALIDRRYSIMRSRNGLVKVILENEIVLGWSILPKPTKEFVFDTIDADRLIQKVLDLSSFKENS